MKKISIVLLALILAFSGITVFADSNQNLITVKPGDTFEIPYVIDKNDGIAAFGFDINYDRSVFKDVTTTKGENFSNGLYFDNVVNGVVKIVWTNAQNVNNTGELFRVHFKVAANAKPGKYTIKFINSKADTLNENLQPVSLSDYSVTVEVGGDSLIQRFVSILKTIISLLKALFPIF